MLMSEYQKCEWQAVANRDAGHTYQHEQLGKVERIAA